MLNSNRSLVCRLLAVVLLSLSGQLWAEPTEAVKQLLAEYQAQGAASFDADRGKANWTKEGPEKKGKVLSCSSCHGADLAKPGKHIRTQKVIKPMALSAQPDRYQDIKKIRKWLKRNCKGTWGRECTPQEKGDFLTYLNSL